LSSGAKANGRPRRGIRRAAGPIGQPCHIAAIRFDGCGIKPTGDNILLWGDGGGERGGTAERIEAGKPVGTGVPGIAGTHTPAQQSRQTETASGLDWSRFASADAPDAVDRAVEGDDLADAGGFGLSDEIGFGEVEAGGLVDLECTHEQWGVDCGDARQRQGGSHEFSDARRLDFVEGFEHVDALGEDQIGKQKRSRAAEDRCGARGLLRRVAGQVAYQNVGVEERSQEVRPARAARV
jgi:hypothetical protein